MLSHIVHGGTTYLQNGSINALAMLSDVYDTYDTYTDIVLNLERLDLCIHSNMHQYYYITHFNSLRIIIYETKR